MIRSALSKVAWVGRTASMVFGLALVMALVLGVSSVALAGNLDPLKLGSLRNVATKTTALVGKVATGSALVVKNPSGGSALGLQVNAGQAPLMVNAAAGTATNLSADELDGKDSAAFLQAYAVSEDHHVVCTNSFDPNFCNLEYIRVQCDDVGDYPLEAGRVTNLDPGSSAPEIEAAAGPSSDLVFSIHPDGVEGGGDDVTIEFLCFDADGDGATL